MATKKLDIEHYVKMIKEHEAKRLSFNERQAYWKSYFNEGKNTVGTDAGFDMSKF